MSKQLKMPKDWKQFLMEELVGQHIDKFHVVKVLGAGKTAVTYEVLDEGGRPWALKVMDAVAFGEGASIRDVARFRAVEDDRYLVFPQEADRTEIAMADRKRREFVWFKSKRVNGVSLDGFLGESKRFSISSEVERFLTCLTVGLEALSEAGFCHGDLHSRNIMREVVGQNGVNPEVRFVIIDFSEAYRVEDPGRGQLDDLEMLGQHLRQFSEVASRRRDLLRDDLRTLVAIQHIPGQLNGTSSAEFGLSNPKEVYERYRAALRDTTAERRVLISPFESLSTENLVSDRLIADLCFTEMSWTKKLQESGNLLLIGPRGCGKTMLFRRMRLKTKLSAEEYDEIENDNYVGLYIPCESLFYMSFADLPDVMVDRKKGQLISYFNACLAAEALATLSQKNELIGTIPTAFVEEVSSLLEEELGTVWPQARLARPTISTRELSESAQRSLRLIRRGLALHEPIETAASMDFLSRLVRLLKKYLPIFADRHVIVFLDDYTEERVPRALQVALHPIVCQRSSEVSFKISAHMFGCIYDSPRPLARDEGRNIEIINLGTMYMKRGKRGSEARLLLKILNKRFEHCSDYDGTLEEWLGKTKYPNNWTLSRALHEPQTQSRVKYHGVKCLEALCTGDYSEMIRMVGEIFQEAGVKAKDRVRKIDKHIQDQAIRRVSREYLARIRHIRPDGRQLFTITNAFGQMSKTLLEEHPLVGQGTDAKGNPREDPYDLLTIYVDKLTEATGAAQSAWMRLQKASIFSDIGLARSIREVIADRVTLRRLYCPAFGTTYTSSEHFQMTKKQFELFMDDPYLCCKMRIEETLKPEKVEKTLPLWEESAKARGEQVASEAETKKRRPRERVYVSPSPHETWDEEAKKRGQGVIEELMDRGLPERDALVNYEDLAPKQWRNLVMGLPELIPADTAIEGDEQFDLLIAALGFEERTHAGVIAFAERGIRVDNVILLELDRYLDENNEQRSLFEEAIREVTQGKSQWPLLAPVNIKEDLFSGPLKTRLNQLVGKERKPRIVFDITSCPSLILSKALRVILAKTSELQILYSEAAKYFPRIKDLRPTATWPGGKPDESSALAPVRGFDYFVAPPTLRTEDVSELPVLAVLFPTLSTERTEGVISHVGPHKRIWVFSEIEEEYPELGEAAIRFASPLMEKGDEWSQVKRMDYKSTLLALAGIYTEWHGSHRIEIMPHGSKMQTVAAGVFSLIHEASLVFAMPKTYNPKEYSEGCKRVWSLNLQNTSTLINNLNTNKVYPTFYKEQ